MIEKLTKKQEELLGAYREKWIKIGLSTKQVGVVETKKIINDLYSTILIQPLPKKIYIAKGPLHAWAMVMRIKNHKSPENLTAQQIKLWSTKEQIIWPYLDGSFFSSPIAFYDFFQTECKINFGNELSKRFTIWKNTTKLGLIYPFDDVCVVSTKPKEIFLNSSGELHRDGGPALVYDDGTCVYALNGVRFSDPTLVIKERKKFTKKDILSIVNVDQRREIVAKLGVSLIIEILKPEILDTMIDELSGDQYTLYNVNIDDTRVRPYLKMWDAAAKKWIIEGVAPEVTTCKAALAWRLDQEIYDTPRVRT